MDISHLRENYTQAGLDHDSLNQDPFLQFDLWFKQAQEAGLSEPNAMSLATASANGAPSLRTVLLKYVSSEGFVFFTNYNSNKAKDINENPNVALMFPWNKPGTTGHCSRQSRENLRKRLPQVLHQSPPRQSAWRLGFSAKFSNNGQKVSGNEAG